MEQTCEPGPTCPREVETTPTLDLADHVGRRSSSIIDENMQSLWFAPAVIGGRTGQRTASRYLSSEGIAAQTGLVDSADTALADNFCIQHRHIGGAIHSYTPFGRI